MILQYGDTVYFQELYMYIRYELHNNLIRVSSCETWQYGIACHLKLYSTAPIYTLQLCSESHQIIP